MEIYTQTETGALFPKDICRNELILFHGTHESNTEKIEAEGIKRPEYPEEIKKLITEYREVASVLNLSYALKTYQDTYQGKSNIVFLSKYCSGAAGYVRGKSGEEINTLQVSTDRLNLLINDKKHLQQEVSKRKMRVNNSWGQDKKDHQEKLKALQNIEQYEPLLKSSQLIIQQYPELFGQPKEKGIVYAVNTDQLEIEDQGNDGYSTTYVPSKHFVAKSKFELDSQKFIPTCSACKGNL